MRPAGAYLGDRVEGDAPDLRAGVREDRGEVRNLALAGVPSAREAAEAQEEQRFLFETEDGQDRPVALDSAPGSEREDLRRATSGTDLSLTINQEVSNLVVASVLPSIALSII